MGGALLSAIAVGAAAHFLAAISPAFRFWLIVVWGGSLILLLVSPSLGAAWWLGCMFMSILLGLVYFMIVFWYMWIGWILGFVMLGLLLVGLGELVR